MRRIAVALSVVLVTVMGCAAPAPPADCWLALRGTYHLTEVAADAAINETANTAGIMEARLSAVGLADFRVATDSSVITVDLPSLEEEASDEIRGLLRTTGHLAIIPVPVGDDVAPGDPAPAGRAPGRRRPT